MARCDKTFSRETMVTDKKESIDEPLAEASVRGILLGVLLTLVLATANAWLALKLGILTSASIPAAIISMGVLRFFKKPSILENNMVQTVASAGEAVAGGIVYTIPALIIIGFWDGFDYFTNFFIAATGGILGVLFSIPLRLWFGCRLCCHHAGRGLYGRFCHGSQYFYRRGNSLARGIAGDQSLLSRIIDTVFSRASLCLFMEYQIAVSGNRRYVVCGFVDFCAIG